MVEVAREYFDAVIYRTPESPSFAGAVQWCWSQVETEFFFHLEDDWILRRRIPVADLLALFNDGDVSGVSLNMRTKRSALRWLRRREGTAKWYGDDYLHWAVIALSPSFYRTARIQPFAAKLTPDHDPEYQLNELRTDDPGILLWHTHNPPTLINSGIPWRKRRAMEKSFDGSGETYAPTTKLTRLRYLQLTLRYHIRKWIWKMRYC